MSLSPEQSRISPSRKAGYIIALALSPVFFIFAYLGQPERGFITMCVLGVFATVVYVRRRVARQPYFIWVIAPFFIVELALTLCVPMSEEHFPGILLMPFAILNVIVLLAILRLVEANIAQHSK